MKGSEELRGIPASPGVSIGPVFVYRPEEYCVLKHTMAPSQIPKEVVRFKAAIKKTKVELKALQRRVEKEIGAGHANIFMAHLQIMDDPVLMFESIGMVKKNRWNIEYALQQSINKLAHMIESLPDDLLRERSHDIRDVGRRMMKHLVGRVHETLADLDAPVVIVAPQLTPSDTVNMRREHILGFVTEAGGRMSHSAIMARALEIPAVVGLKHVTEMIQDNETVIVDGIHGVVVIRPTEAMVRHYSREREAYLAKEHELEKLRDVPARTQDKQTFSLMANIEISEEIALAEKHGASGVGLYRTEFLYLNRDTLPLEEEQYEAYRLVLERMNPRPVVIRTIDLGGDKIAQALHFTESNAHLKNLRAIRLCLAMPELFKTQLRALLKASVHGNLHIMFPMISTVEEFVQARKILQEAKRELKKEGVIVCSTIKIGAMVEVPSIAVSLEALAREVDFVSIGTNDLFQYLFAIDRTDEVLSSLYDPLQPAMLRLLNQVLHVAKRAGISVAMCGEMAGDPAMTVVLAGLGLKNFSMTPGSIPLVKKVIQHMKYDHAKKVAAKALTMSTAHDIRALLPRIHGIL